MGLPIVSLANWAGGRGDRNLLYNLPPADWNTNVSILEAGSDFSDRLRRKGTQAGFRGPVVKNCSCGLNCRIRRLVISGWPSSMWLGVCVCVTETEKDRERDGEREKPGIDFISPNRSEGV